MVTGNQTYTVLPCLLVLKLLAYKTLATAISFFCGYNCTLIRHMFSNKFPHSNSPTLPPVIFSPFHSRSHELPRLRSSASQLLGGVHKLGEVEAAVSVVVGVLDGVADVLGVGQVERLGHLLSLGLGQPAVGVRVG